MKEEGLHTHVFSVVEGDIGLGHELVRHKDIKAVGFTGSLFAGQSLLKTAQSRDEPIPFYAEMGSVNPVFIFPEALNTNYLEISKGCLLPALHFTLPPFASPVLPVAVSSTPKYIII
eukprot:TRINITY_DN3080_c0_g1_i1.p1 TRINITY_DN3080_c0_g1~~TRINITY_DN3080_c0_g1_i1.p1  ORF type:complete len:117 (-),score=7.46 TRINITY_DN3080_c0_g1_i1:8-358(-)